MALAARPTLNHEAKPFRASDDRESSIRAMPWNAGEWRRAREQGRDLAGSTEPGVDGEGKGNEDTRVWTRRLEITIVTLHVRTMDQN